MYQRIDNFCTLNMFVVKLIQEKAHVFQFRQVAND